MEAKSFFLIFRRSSLVRNIATLATGSIIGQGLIIVTMPLLTRLYSPSDHGKFALFFSLVSIIGIISCGSYERAVILPKNDSDSVNILKLAILINLSVSGLVLILVILFRLSISRILGVPELAVWFYGIPISIFAVGFFEIMRFWLVRGKKFKNLSTARVFQTSSGVGIQIGFGLWPIFRFGGLIVGRISGIFLGAMLMAIRAWKQNKKLFLQRVQPIKILNIAKKYRKFPFFLSWSLVIAQISFWAPAIILAVFFSPAIVGFFSLVVRLTSAPMQLIGDSIEQVFFKHATEEKHEFGTAKNSTEKVFLLLFLISIIPIILIILFAKELFGFIFGPEWQLSGQMAVWLSPMIWLYFLVSPLFPIFNTFKKQEVLFILQAVRCAMSILPVYLIGKISGDIKLTILAYSISQSVLFFISLLFLFRYSGSSFKGILGHIKPFSSLIR